MKTKIQVLIVILLCLGQLTAQVTVDILYHDNREGKMVCTVSI